MQPPILYRKRFIPNETVCLKNDRILHYEDHLILTAWQTLKPRKDIAKGISAYFPNEGFKISKIYDHNNQLVYWYCDIIETTASPDKTDYIFEDLLIDVVVRLDGSVRVLDMGEIADAVECGLITCDLAMKALRITDRLLNLIENGRFVSYIEIINRAEEEHRLSE